MIKHLHLQPLPSGILYDNKQNIVGTGVVIDPKVLQEIEGLEKQGKSAIPSYFLTVRTLSCHTISL